MKFSANGARSARLRHCISSFKKVVDWILPQNPSQPVVLCLKSARDRGKLICFRGLCVRENADKKAIVFQ